jgi:prevent-host-death family protein
MTKTLTLREANQTFARCIRAVEAGEDFVITRNGTPKLTPVSARRVLSPAQQKALAELMEGMNKGWHLGGEKFDRDALHER